MDFIRSIKTLAGFKGRKGTKEGLNVLHLEDENRVVAIDRKGEEVPFGSGVGSGDLLEGLFTFQQFGGADPMVLTDIKNETGISFTPARINKGIYTLRSDISLAGKVVTCIITMPETDTQIRYARCYRLDDNNIMVETFDQDGAQEEMATTVPFYGTLKISVSDLPAPILGV